MDKILVHGGRRLSGSIKVSGSKNSSLPILAATLLTREPCVVHGVPDLSDTNYMLQILAHLGAQVERASGTVTVTAEKIHCVAPYDVVRKMRASVCVLGPLLGRCKEASVALPGGCVIGDRPIDLHLKGFEALGSAVRVEGGDIKVFAPKLRAAQIDMKGQIRSDCARYRQRNDGSCLGRWGDYHRRSSMRTRGRGPGKFPQQNGRKDRRCGHGPDCHRRRA